MSDSDESRESMGSIPSIRPIKTTVVWQVSGFILSFFTAAVAIIFAMNQKNEAATKQYIPLSKKQIMYLFFGCVVANIVSVIIAFKEPGYVGWVSIANCIVNVVFLGEYHNIWTENGSFECSDTVNGLYIIATSVILILHSFAIKKNK